MRGILGFFALFALSTGLAAADTLPPQLMAAFANFQKAKSYHVTVNSHGQQMDLDVVNPGRQHMTMRGGQMEMIRIDADTYVKIGGTWQKFSMPGMDAMISKYAQFRDFGTTHTADTKVTDLGMTTLGADPMHEYELTSSAGTPTDVYVGADGLVHQMIVKEKDGTATIGISGYNAPITIAAPL